MVLFNRHGEHGVPHAVGHWPSKPCFVIMPVGFPLRVVAVLSRKASSAVHTVGDITRAHISLQTQVFLSVM